MASIGKVLGEGQLAASKGTLYTVPASRVAYVKTLVVYNTGGGTETVNLYVKPASTSRQVLRLSLATLQSYWVDFPLVLEAGDLIEGDTTTATTVNYVIMGAEEVA